MLQVNSAENTNLMCIVLLDREAKGGGDYAISGQTCIKILGKSAVALSHPHWKVYHMLMYQIAEYMVKI